MWTSNKIKRAGLHKTYCRARDTSNKQQARMNNGFKVNRNRIYPLLLVLSNKKLAVVLCDFVFNNIRCCVRIYLFIQRLSYYTHVDFVETRTLSKTHLIELKYSTFVTAGRNRMCSCQALLFVLVHLYNSVKLTY